MGFYRSHVLVSIDPACVAQGAYEILCPVNAIDGERRQLHEIDPDRRIRCGICMQVCDFNAVVVR